MKKKAMGWLSPEGDGMDSNPITHPDMNKNAKGWLSPEGDLTGSSTIPTLPGCCECPG